MAPAPTDIRVIREDRVVELTWQDGRVSKFPFRFLRGRCPCAACVDEFTGERMVDAEDVSAGVSPVGVSLTGNYALKIQWSDDHDTGLYIWEWLDRLAAEVTGHETV